MFRKILVPVDLAHMDQLGRAFDVACDLARHYDTDLVFAGVTSPQPTAAAHSPEEYRSKLAAAANEVTGARGTSATVHVEISHDPAVDLDAKLIGLTDSLGADLVVMATHLPERGDWLLPNHGGALARHSKISVLLVRG